ncbi:hypothetical protein M5K25_018380 [Dendrobium thyrsiflorum]|uniref:EF-hand domain-containing protein n=1 Tax=Dendrobium thyrsiflorum TaxID=117978 RepID=A0ABD0UIV6_DENTH
MLDPDPKRMFTAQEVHDPPWLQNTKKAPNVNLDIKEMFKKLDVDNNGRITIEELKSELHQLGHQIPNADVQILIDVADVDGDGTLEFGEFVAMSIHIKKLGNDKHLHKAFTSIKRRVDTLK